MKKIRISEGQFKKLFEGVESDFGTDSTPGGMGSQVTTSGIIHDANGDKKMSEPTNADEVQDELTPQAWWTRRRV